MSATPKFAHVVFQTTRREQMLDFYCTLLDGWVVFDSPGLSLMTFDDEHHRVAFIAPPVQLADRPPASSGMHHIAYTFPDLDSLLDRYLTLKDRGVEPAVPVQHGPTTSLYYRDPDGSFIEMQVDNFRTAEEVTSYMTGEEYTQDPIGPSFRPELMVEERRRGTRDSELTTRRWARTSSPDLPHPMAALSA